MESEKDRLRSSIQPGKERVTALLDEACAGTLVLPEFQRSFIWTRKDIEELLVSLVNGYFIGTLLLLQIDARNPPFAPRVLEGVEAEVSDADIMVLDGQQRLTSLYYALHGLDLPLSNTRHPQRFFLDIEKVLQGDIENSVNSISVKDMTTLTSEEEQFRIGLLPFTKLVSWTEFDDWRERYRDYLIRYNRFDKDRYERIRNLARGFLEYEVPYVKLDRKTNLDAVVEVFERINRTGTPLSIFALVTARLYNHAIKLRDLWFDAYDTNPSIQDFCGRDDEEVARMILQVISLMRGKECKRKDLIALEPAGFSNDWLSAVAYVEKALARLSTTNSSGYGVLSRDWLPYSTITAPLAMLLYTADKHYQGQNEPYEKLHRWYWSSVFAERYAGASDTVIHNDSVQVARWFANSKDIPESVQRASKPDFEIDLNRSRRGAIYKAIMCLVALNGALDFRTGDTIELHVLDDHHIFPKKFLGTSFATDEINSILNRTLISRETNRNLIRDRPPSQYVADMERQMGAEKMQRVLASHFINEDAIVCMKSDDFMKFTSFRRDSLMAEIRKRCG